MSLLITLETFRTDLSHLRGIFQGLGNIAFGLGTGLGAPIGGIINDTLGWRLAFGLQVGISTVVPLRMLTPDPGILRRRSSRLFQRPLRRSLRPDVWRRNPAREAKPGTAAPPDRLVRLHAPRWVGGGGFDRRFAQDQLDFRYRIQVDLACHPRFVRDVGRALCGVLGGRAEMGRGARHAI